MRISKYTFLFDINAKEFYAYNTLTNALIEIDEESYFFLRVNKGLDFGESCVDEELREALLQNGILTENDEDDYLKYKAYIMRLRTQRNSMHLTIAPTMDCCFRCHYCFEKYKEKIYMSHDVMDAIVKYISSFKDLNNINITWFGGEPLMAVSEIEEFYDKLYASWKRRSMREE